MSKPKKENPRCPKCDMELMEDGTCPTGCPTPASEASLENKSQDDKVLLVQDGPNCRHCGGELSADKICIFGCPA